MAAVPVRVRRLAISTALVALLALGLASVSRAAIYWAGQSPVGAAGIGGSEPNPSYLRMTQQMMGPTCDVAVDATHLYWSEWFGIWRVNFEGPAVPSMIVPGATNSCGIALSGTHVFWVNRVGQAIGRAALDGSGRIDAFLGVPDGACDVGVGGGFLFWSHARGIGRADLDGSGVEPEWLTDVNCKAIAVDGGYLYFGTDAGTIGRASLDGAEVEASLIAGAGRVTGLAVESGNVYWVETPEGMFFSRIGMATIGGPVIPGLIPTESFNVGGVAADARTQPPPLPLPSRPFSMGGKASHDMRKGVATVDVSVPERGELVVTNRKLGWKVLKGPEPPRGHGGSFRWRLKIWAASGPMGKGLRTKLRNKGWANVIVRATYNETDQLPVTETKRVTLRKRVTR